ncbi:hypothetical protein M8C21_006214, partial [Ambrosia artemisiifolia]
MIEWYDGCLNALNNVERLTEKHGVADIIQAKVVQTSTLMNECILNLMAFELGVALEKEAISQ